MNQYYRIVDANANRAAEGLRVLEDLARFLYNSRTVSEQLKKVRHAVRKGLGDHQWRCLEERKATADVGVAISRELMLDTRTSLYELVTANCKRVQEALRVLEENLRVLGRYELAKEYEAHRFTAYQLEKELFKLDRRLRNTKKLDTDLYCLTAEEFSRGRSNLEVAGAMIRAGIKLIQYREKDKKPGEKLAECEKLRELTAAAGVTFIVNDHVDIALMVQADGVHVGQDDLPVDRVRELVGEDMIIGLSTHSPEQARAAVVKGVDYIGVGPIFKTYTKKDVCDPVGLEYLEYAVKNIQIPFVAIGGIKEANIAEVKARGAKCIALVTEIVGVDDIEAKIAGIREKMKGIG